MLYYSRRVGKSFAGDNGLTLGLSGVDSFGSNTRLVIQREADVSTFLTYAPWVGSLPGVYHHDAHLPLPQPLLRVPEIERLRSLGKHQEGHNSPNIHNKPLYNTTTFPLVMDHQVLHHSQIKLTKFNTATREEAAR